MEACFEMNFNKMRKGYRNLFDRCKVSNSKLSKVKSIAQRIVDNQGRYEGIAKRVGCPWWWIGVVHQMEGGGFKAHLHNGDPLTSRTRQVPAGRPKTGTPPFTWEESALDALTHQGINKVKDWCLERCLFEWEKYNGWGYIGKTNSPYLWSYTNLYTRGKYVRDGVYSATAISQQAGAAAILKGLIALGVINQGEDQMNALTIVLTQFIRVAPLLVEGMSSQPRIIVKALAERLSVGNTPEEVANAIETIPFSQGINILKEVESMLNDVLTQDPPMVANAPAEGASSPIDDQLGLTGYKTIIGLGIAVVAWILSGTGVIDANMAQVGYGLGVFVGGVGAKAWLDRLHITLTSK